MRRSSGLRVTGRRIVAAAASFAISMPFGARAATIEPSFPGESSTASAQAVVNVANLRDEEHPQDFQDTPYLAPPMDLPVFAPQHETAQEAPAEPPPESDPPDSPPPTFSFQALGDNNTFIPPDTHGAVGPQHLMVTLNSEVRIQTRSGGILSTFSLASFWSPVGVTDVFDPKVLYDPYGNRWMTTAVAERGSGASSVLIAASAGTNPTDTWFLYRFDADPGDTYWADYPALGFNKDWIVVRVNMFANSSGGFYGTKIFTFNKSSLYSGGTGSATVFTLTGHGANQVPAITHDSSLWTMYLLANWNGNSGGSGFLRMYTITGLVGSETLSVGSLVSTPNPWASSPPSGADFAPQSGTTQKVQNNFADIQNVVYRNGYLWTTHTIFLPAGGSPTRSAVQWWQISTSGSIVQRGRIEDTTGGKFYAFPSIAVNAVNDVLLGYSRFSASQFVSANYSFRNASTPANSMLADTVLKAGEAKYYKTYRGTRNRWGDYSNTVVDPINDTNFWTIQQYAWTPAGGFDRWATWWGGIVLAAAGVSPASLAFGNVYPGEASASQTVTLTNASAGPIDISSITIQGTHPTDFFITSNNCPAQLQSGYDCAVAVAFSPSATGSRSGSLAFYSDAPESPHLVILSGTGNDGTIQPPDPPGDPAAVAGPGDGQITVSWSPPPNTNGAPVDKYKVYVGANSSSFSLLAEVGSDQLQYVHSGLGSYVAFYRISAVNIAGEGLPSDVVSIQPPDPPADPAAVAGPGDGQITVSWSPPPNTNGAPVDKYKVYVGANSSSFSLLAEVGSDQLQYVHSGLGSYVERFYRISAVNIAGEGLPSDVVSARTFVSEPPSAPVNLRVQHTPFTLGQVRLVWANPTKPNGLITSYRVYRGTMTGRTFLAEVSGVTAYTDTTCKLLTICFYTVTAVNDAGEGPHSNEVFAPGTRV